jgi:hypothetical protein
MASYSVTAGNKAVYDKTLVANTADTVTFADNVDRVEIITDGAAELFVRVSEDGAAATVGGANTDMLPAGGSSSLDLPSPGIGGTVVSLISSGTPKYSVIGS